jgi:iron complex outermembrane receptor protein
VSTAEQRITTVSALGQYELTVVPEHFRLIAGAKVEHNSYTGFEIQPQIRGVWSFEKAHIIWAAVSRAVRTPTRLENDEQFKLFQLPAEIPTYLSVFGNPGLKSEVLRAYEIGYRFNPTPAFALDAASFYNHYDHLINVNMADPLAVAGPPVIHQDPTYVEVPVPWQNLGSGQTHGAELYVKVMPVSHWLLSTGITELRGNSLNQNNVLNLPAANTPRHQFNLQSRFDLTSRVDLDSTLYHYGGIPRLPFGEESFQDVPTHNRLDVGLSLHRIGGFTFSVWGRDITSNLHWENRSALFTSTGTEVGRSVVFRVRWQSHPEKAPSH